MKKLNGNKSGSSALFITAASVALIGFSAYALGKSGLLQQKREHSDRISAIDNQLIALAAENKSLKHDIELLSASLERMALQNEKLLKTNNDLAKALEEEQNRVLELMNVVIEENEEKLILERKLEEAINKLAAGSSPAATEHPNEAKAAEHIA